MNDLQKFTNDNRSLFDDQEPAEGHFQRFEARLDEVQSNRKKTIYLRVLSVAASLALLISVGTYLLKGNTNGSNEIYIVQSYYLEQMAEELTSIECKLEQVDPETKDQLEMDLQTLQRENEEFLKDVQNSGDQEMMLEYLEQHYQTKLRALNLINNKLGDFVKC